MPPLTYIHASEAARTTAALPFTHRTAKVTIRPLETSTGNAMHATATVSLTNLAGVSSGTTVTPMQNADYSFTAIIAPQTIAATTAFVSIGYSGSTWAYKPGATTFAAASAYTFNVSYTDPYTGHAYVDMGNGLKWATCNVGADNPQDYGDYFDWGATVPYYQDGHSQDNPCSDWIDGKVGYNWANYSFMEDGQSSWQYITKYTFADGRTSGIWYDGDTFIGDGKTSFADYGYVDDAARANWGGNWRTPTDAEWTWLRENCTWAWKTTDDGYAHNGMLVTSNVNGNQIFLPAAGYRSNASLGSGGSGSCYWSSSLNGSYSAEASLVYFGSGGVHRGSSSRYYGQSVRPVSN